MVIAVAAVGGHSLAKYYVGGFSLTAWFTLATISISVIYLLVANFPSQARFSSVQFKKHFCLSWAVWLSFLAITLAFSPTWDGAQLFLSQISFFLVFVSLWQAMLSDDLILNKIVLSLILFLLLLPILSPWIAASDFLVGRDRGEVTAIAAAASIALKLNPSSRILVTFLLGLAVVFSDSRGSTILMVGVVALASYNATSSKYPAMKILSGGLSAAIFVITAHLIETIAGLRYSFPWLRLESAQSEPLRNSLLGDTGNSGLNGLSSGRTEVWSHLIKTIDSSQHLLFGMGPGFSALEGVKINTQFSQPHNEFIRVLVDLGVFGLLVGAVAYAFLYWMVLRSTTSGSSARVAALAVLFIHFGHLTFSNPLVKPYFFLSLAAVLVILMEAQGIPRGLRFRNIPKKEIDR